MKADDEWGFPKDNSSLRQLLAEICDVEVSLLSGYTAPAALKREFSRVPDESVIAVLSRIDGVDRRDEVEGALRLYTSWTILQRVVLAGEDIALLLVPTA